MQNQSNHMNKLKELDLLIHWLEEIHAGRYPEIPYNLHTLVRSLHDSLGTESAIRLLQELKEIQN